VLRAKNKSLHDQLLLRALTDVKEVYGDRQEIFVGINACLEGKERKIRGEVADMLEVFKTDPIYKVEESLGDDFLIVVSPNTFEFNRGNLNYF
jgi:hypothetical protein